MENRLETMEALFNNLNEQNRERLLWIAKHMKSSAIDWEQLQQSADPEGKREDSDYSLPH